MSKLGRSLLALVAMLAGASSLARAEVTTLGPADATSVLTVWAATDLDELRPALEDFLALHPDTSIAYHDLQTGVLYHQMKTGQPPPPDLAISSAADLQIKLVNDGYAVDHFLPAGIVLPTWASWRNQAFGISTEPSVIVYHKSLSTILPPPTSRQDLADALRQHAELFDGRVATYDIFGSGVGYLFASQDALYSSSYTTLMQSFGRVRAHLYCCSGQMLDELESGRLLMAYNVLGSYALARKLQGAPIEIVLPDDFTLVLSRVAIIPRGARRPDLGAALLDFLLSPAGRGHFRSLPDYGRESETPWHPIALNPALLVSLDSIRKESFMKTWKSLVSPDHD